MGRIDTWCFWKIDLSYNLLRPPLTLSLPLKVLFTWAQNPTGYPGRVLGMRSSLASVRIYYCFATKNIRSSKWWISAGFPPGCPVGLNVKYMFWDIKKDLFYFWMSSFWNLFFRIARLFFFREGSYLSGLSALATPVMSGGSRASSTNNINDPNTKPLNTYRSAFYKPYYWGTCFWCRHFFLWNCSAAAFTAERSTAFRTHKTSRSF